MWTVRTTRTSPILNRLTHVSLSFDIGGFRNGLSIRVGELSLFHPGKVLVECAEIPVHHHIHKEAIF